ncbi:uncharacterized protein BYT42DRAFT_297169 [Radiomyces spectabilis]|uniref:uncharacterized protein n=1 Tax=Radiomyces spectabilis TaxID=64574 RepID=UPI00221E441B|nr:uncharacterized protein BYT42DRAFT_297169 [Radiomyces spectabilis]KAI8381190.1 hypothetical protein BYT42DRAFT_297169 [Radiomyces spectabilis]
MRSLPVILPNLFLASPAALSHVLLFILNICEKYKSKKEIDIWKRFPCPSFYNCIALNQGFRIWYRPISPSFNRFCIAEEGSPPHKASTRTFVVNSGPGKLFYSISETLLFSQMQVFVSVNFSFFFLHHQSRKSHAKNTKNLLSTNLTEMRRGG